ncbi:MAG: T9SS type A sorting domain-containing protein [Flavobacteriales bacterium]|jgi:hypothetical protein|nr:T9SS type A sorting domain-containing protein [Flavobacteriales bacterium]
MKRYLKFFSVLLFTLFAFQSQEAKAQSCATLSFDSLRFVYNGIPGSYSYRAYISNTGTAVTGANVVLNITNILGGALQAPYNNTMTGQTLSTGSNTVDFLITNNLVNATNHAIGGVIIMSNVNITATGISGCVKNAPNYLVSPLTEWGCTDPASVNYGSQYKLNDGSCLSSFCSALNVFNVVQIKQDGAGTTPYIQFAIQNNSSVTITNASFSFSITTINPGVPLDLSADVIPSIPSGSFGIVKVHILNNVSNLTGQTFTISGKFSSTFPQGPETCDITVPMTTISTDNIGCTDPNAMNYNQYANVDDGECVDPIDITLGAVSPYCQGGYGSVTCAVDGGTPPYSFNFNSFDSTALLPGNYTFSVQDNTPAKYGGPFTEIFQVSISSAPPFICNLTRNGSMLEATINGNNPNGSYIWLKDGQTEDTTSVNEYPIDGNGVYKCYVESDPNPDLSKCWTYSNAVKVTDAGIEIIDYDAIQIYPNPNNGVFIVDLGTIEAEGTLFVRDIQGKLVEQQSILSTRAFTHQMDLTHLSKGMYLIEITTENKRMMSKIVIQ